MAARRRISRRLSATKRSSRPPPDPIVYFLDRSLGSRVVGDALKAAGALVELHRDHFADDAPDEEWLAVVGRRGWVVLAKDKAIRRTPLELNAVLIANVRAFFLTSGQMTGEEMARVYVRHLSRIENLVRSRRPPFIASVTSTSVRVIEAGRKRSRR
jgi:predicted nuclease of predicted toxin-antitoxin system